MKELRRHPTALAMLVVGALALWVAVVAVRAGWFRSAPDLPAGSRVAATASLTPRSHYYGDRVTAELELLFRHDAVPVRSLAVTAPFTPYTVLGSDVRRQDAGDATRLVYRFRLLCISAACLPQNRRSVTLPRATVRYTPAGSIEQETMHVGWPAVAIASRRLVRFQARPLLAAHLRPLPELTYRVRPGVLAAAALAGSIALLLLAVGLLFPALPRRLGVRRPGWLKRRVRPLTPLEQALARVRAAAANGGGDERRALEQLAVELAGSGERSLARDARRLAWSPGRPPADGIDELSGEVEQLIGAAR
jgi:hypothetical protein